MCVYALIALLMMLTAVQQAAQILTRQPFGFLRAGFVPLGQRQNL